MGQTESRSQNPGPLDLGSEVLNHWTKDKNQKQSFFIRGELQVGTEIKVITQTDNLLNGRFIWQQEVDSFRKDRNVFVARGFEMTSKTGKVIILKSRSEPFLRNRV